MLLLTFTSERCLLLFYMWVPGKLSKPRKISTQENEEERFQRKTPPSSVCVHFSYFQFSLTLPIHTFQVIKKEKKQIIFLYINVVVFLCCIKHFTIFCTFFFYILLAHKTVYDHFICWNIFVYSS